MSPKTFQIWPKFETSLELLWFCPNQNTCMNKYLETIQFKHYFLGYDIRSWQGMYFLKIAELRHDTNNDSWLRIYCIRRWKILLPPHLMYFFGWSLWSGEWMASSKLNLDGGLFRNLWSSWFVRGIAHACVSFVGDQILLLRSLVSGLNVWTLLMFLCFCAWWGVYLGTVDLISYVKTISTWLASYFLTSVIFHRSSSSTFRRIPVSRTRWIMLCRWKISTMIVVLSVPVSILNRNLLYSPPPLGVLSKCTTTPHHQFWLSS